MQIRRDHDHRFPAFGERLDHTIELRPRAHVDADGRLVEHVNRIVAAEPFAEQNLLLIAARELRHEAAKHVAIEADGLGDPCDRLDRSPAAQAVGPEHAERDIVGGACGQHQSFVLSVRREVMDSCRDDRIRPRAGHVLAVEDNLAGKRPVEAHHRAPDARLARAD